MAKVAGILSSATLFMLLSGCGGQLISEAQKVANQIVEESTTAATKQIDAAKNDTLEMLKKMQVEDVIVKANEKSEKIPEKVAEEKVASKPEW